MHTFRKLKSLFSVLLIILVIFSLYFSYCSNTQSISVTNISLFTTLMAALFGFIDGLEYIIIKKNTKIGYAICTISIMLPIPIIILIHYMS